MKSENPEGDERVLLKIFGIKLLSFRRAKDGRYVGTGLLNPLLNLFSFFSMLIVNAQFYKHYTNLGKWKGKRVSNTFAPPVGSRPQLRALLGLTKTHLLKHTSPIAMTFAVTYRCQLSCVHCSAADHFIRGAKELTTEEAKRLIDESERFGVTIIAFTGGEPLVRPDIFELIDYVDQKKAMPLLFTNGLLLTEENVKKLADAGLYSLFVSLDSPIPEEHDRLRGLPGLFDIALEGIKRAKEQGIFVGISSYIGRLGAEKGMYKKMYKLSQEVGVQNLLLFDSVPTGRLIHDTRDILTEKQRERIAKFSEMLFTHDIIPPLSSQSWQNSLEAYIGGFGCLAANIQYHVTAYGEVTPCDFTPLSFGNIRKEPLKRIIRRMIKHPAFNHRTSVCRMQNPYFRHFYVDPIPPGSKLPYPIDKLPKVDYRNEAW